MEATIHMSDMRLHRTIDVVCTLMIGLGLGGLSMYWYAVSHPQDVMQAQSHVLIAPQTTSNTDGADKTPVKTPVKAGPTTLQI